MKQKLNLVLLLLPLLGCRGKTHEAESEVQLTNATEDKNNRFPQVVKLGPHRNCTGTVVGDNVVITAAHCVDHKLESGAVNAELAGEELFASKKAYIFSGHEQREGGSRDLAFVVYYKNFGVEPLAIASRPAVKDEEVLLVGYGHDQSWTILSGVNAKQGPRRYGTNFVDTVGDMLRIYRRPFRDVSFTGFGDSGGPMLRRAGDRYELIGIFSQHSLIRTGFVNLTTPEKQKFAAQLRADGVDIRTGNNRP